MKRNEIREFLESICRQRRQVMRLNRSRINPQQSDIIINKIETWLAAHPDATLRGLAMFYFNHSQEIHFITPTRFADDAREKQFWHLLHECKDIISSQLKIAV
jgi:hypothetical protein